MNSDEQWLELNGFSKVAPSESSYLDGWIKTKNKVEIEVEIEIAYIFDRWVCLISVVLYSTNFRRASFKIYDFGLSAKDAYDNTMKSALSVFKECPETVAELLMHFNDKKEL